MFIRTALRGLSINEVFLLPLTPLTTGTAYAVTVNGSSNGVGFTKTFPLTPSL